MKRAINRACLVVLLALGTTEIAAAIESGLQIFSELAPADLQKGRVIISGPVIHRDVDAKWMKIRADSHWGYFTYRVTLLAGPLDSSLPPPWELGGGNDISSRSIEWPAIECTNNGSTLSVEGEIDQLTNAGRVFTGKFYFKSGALRLRWEIVENNLYADDPPPTYRNIYYGPDARQRLDVYLPATKGPHPVAVYIHGGAWLKGDKDSLTAQHLLLQEGVAVVAIDYRYIPRDGRGKQPPVAIPLEDAARSIQFIRSHAAEWNINKTRVGVWGASAGAFSALWLATHADLQDKQSRDPVARESTRPQCAVLLIAQTSLDPVQMREWVGPELDYGPHAFGIRGSANKSPFTNFLEQRERLLPWIREYSPAALVNAETPPLFFDYNDLDLQPSLPFSAYYTHSPEFGRGFCTLATERGVECHLRYGAQINADYPTWESFIVRKLRLPGK